MAEEWNRLCDDPGNNCHRERKCNDDAVYASSANPHASLTWTGYTACLSCHTDKAMEVQASAHYQWEGEALYMVNGAPLQGKLNTAVNSYCGNIIGKLGRLLELPCGIRQETG